MKFFLGCKSMSFCTQHIVAKDVDLRPSAPKVLSDHKKKISWDDAAAILK